MRCLCYWCYILTHTHNGFTPDTRRVVGRPGLTWREVSVRSTGFHYSWTGRRQPGGTLAAGGIREIRLASVEPVWCRPLRDDCLPHHSASAPPVNTNQPVNDTIGRWSLPLLGFRENGDWRSRFTNWFFILLLLIC